MDAPQAVANRDTVKGLLKISMRDAAQTTGMKAT
jgi:hypothetical protein